MDRRLDGSMTRSAGHLLLFFYRCAGPPGPFFLTFGLREPRGSVRLGLGGRFFRASRFSFFRSARSLMLFVFMMGCFAPIETDSLSLSGGPRPPIFCRP